MEEIAIFYSLIKDLCGGRVYPDIIPVQNKATDPAMWPAIRYLVVSGRVESTNCYQSFNPRVQIDIYAHTPQERAQYVQQVMETVQQENEEIDCLLKTAPVYSYDIDRQKYQATFDYMII
jgi:multidrug efflux pump subunit AcrB